jgi:RNA recognition motif-containing protein
MEVELIDAFRKYASYMSRVVIGKRSGECNGYGFVSFMKGDDMMAALRAKNWKVRWDASGVVEGERLE